MDTHHHTKQARLDADGVGSALVKKGTREAYPASYQIYMSDQAADRWFVLDAESQQWRASLLVCP